MAFILKQFEIGPMQNFCYMIGDEKTKQAFIVDPAWAPDKIVNTVEKEGFKLTGLLISHAHYDHTNAIEPLLNKFDIPVYVNANEIPIAESGNPIFGTLGKTAKGLNGGDKIQLGETPILFLHTPGHTPGSQCIQVGDNLITGDTLFVGGCGRSDFHGGDPGERSRSLKKIAQLPPHLQLCPGHDYGEVRQRVLKEEVERNPYLQMERESDFVSAVG